MAKKAPFPISACDAGYADALAQVRVAARKACNAPDTVQAVRATQTKTLMSAERCYATLKLHPAAAPPPVPGGKPAQVPIPDYGGMIEF